MFEKEAEENLVEQLGFDKEFIEQEVNKLKNPNNKFMVDALIREVKFAFQKGAEFGYNKANEWHNLSDNYKDLPNEGEWVEGLYIWYYKDEPHWDVFKVRWCYEIGELDEKLVRWYSSDETNWNKVDEPDYWRKITLPTRNEHDIKY